MGYTRFTKDELRYISDNLGRRKISEIADWIGCSRQAVYYQIQKRNFRKERFWSKGKKETMLQMFLDGMDVVQVADTLGVTTESVRTHLYLMRKEGYNVPSLVELRHKYAQNC